MKLFEVARLCQINSMIAEVIPTGNGTITIRFWAATPAGEKSSETPFAEGLHDEPISDLVYYPR